MTRAVRRAFDRVRAVGGCKVDVPVPLRASCMASVRRSGVRSMSVRAALEWAFGVEHARMDFDLTGARAFDRPGVSPEWVLAQIKAVGCRVDGGGASGAHPDADLIAAAVEALPDRQMAVIVASCARAGVTPDWRGQPVRRIVPRGWDIDDDGMWRAQTALGPETEWRDAKRQRHVSRWPVCPISYGGGAASVAAARRTYLEWYGALIELATTLRRPGYLDAISISSAMPDLAPWKKDLTAPV